MELGIFGDGDTSNFKTLHIHILQAEHLTITLTATIFLDTIPDNQTYITINMPTAPTVTGGSCIRPCSVTLYASGSGTLTGIMLQQEEQSVNTGASYYINHSYYH